MRCITFICSKVTYLVLVVLNIVILHEFVQILYPEFIYIQQNYKTSRSYSSAEPDGIVSSRECSLSQVEPGQWLAQSAHQDNWTDDWQLVDPNLLIYSAYLDDRTVSKPTIRIIARMTQFYWPTKRPAELDLFRCLVKFDPGCQECPAIIHVKPRWRKMFEGDWMELSLEFICDLNQTYELPKKVAIVSNTTTEEPLWTPLLYWTKQLHLPAESLVRSLDNIDGKSLAWLLNKISGSNNARSFDLLKKDNVFRSSDGTSSNNVIRLLDNIREDNAVRSLDDINGENVVRSLDSINGDNIFTSLDGFNRDNAARSLDSINGDNVVRSLDGINADNVVRSLDGINGDNVIRSLDSINIDNVVRSLDGINGDNVIRSLDGINGDNVVRSLNGINGDNVIRSLDGINGDNVVRSLVGISKDSVVRSVDGIKETILLDH
ncbi:uncharacterized protein LOC106458696 isoform X4 [Limulus polyphemus]|uniref:Uncharacterized protein LOC106458696 isoform X4 n=1 Tax=Limulus polyphemus TaxID=6850 RepID=A0ABM1SAN0_LIMPO|nr:uncharacterized protein LOC106458696 isoform X4 [Limulus polyphemus]